MVVGDLGICLAVLLLQVASELDIERDEGKNAARDQADKLKCYSLSQLGVPSQRNDLALV